MTLGKTIQIYVPSGDPRGLRIAEITTRIVRAFEIPRSMLSAFLARAEASQVGIYILFGENDAGVQQAYIGQSGNVGGRLSQHNNNKDFWTRAVAVVSLTNNWTQTHVAYLEWLCIQQALSADRYALENGNGGAKPFTPEALEADCQEVFDTLRILLTTLGHPIFEQLTATSESAAAQGVTTYRCSGKGGADASGLYTAEGFVVLKNSRARKDLTESMRNNEAFYSQRQMLVSSGKLKDDGDTFVFTEDVLFSSPSRASSMVMGRPSNGWIDWVAPNGRTLDQLERNRTPSLPVD